MTSEAAGLFARVRAGILDTCPDVIEMPESRSVGYHDLFREVIPAGATSPCSLRSPSRSSKTPKVSSMTPSATASSATGSTRCRD